MNVYFLFDLELANNFLSLDEKSFKQLYPSINSAEYKKIKDDFQADIIRNLAELMREAENLYIEDLNARKYNLTFNSEQFKITINNYAEANLTKKQYEEYCNLCIEFAC